MRKTNLFEKGLASLINVSAVAILSTPLIWMPWTLMTKKIIVIAIWLLFNLAFLVFNRNRGLGMIIANTHWKKDYPIKSKLLFLVFYSLSFSTLFFWISFPLDLFLANMLLLQVPMILITGTTLHGFLSGKMVTVKNS